MSAPRLFTVNIAPEQPVPGHISFILHRAQHEPDAPAPSAEIPSVMTLAAWGQARADVCRVSLDDWQNAVRITLQTFGASPAILSGLQNQETFWQTLEDIGWKVPGPDPEQIPEKLD